MTEDELDAILGERLRAYAEKRHATGDLENRLLQSVHRRTLIFRIKLFGLVAVVALLTLGLIGVGHVQIDASRSKASLVAADSPEGGDRNSAVTGWMFLGCVRECFKRLRNGRRKDEDPNADLQDAEP